LSPKPQFTLKEERAVREQPLTAICIASHPLAIPVGPESLQRRQVCSDARYSSIEAQKGQVVVTEPCPVVIHLPFPLMRNQESSYKMASIIP